MKYIVPIRIIGSLSVGGVLVNVESPTEARRLAKAFVVRERHYDIGDIVAYKPEPVQKYMDDTLDGGDEETNALVRSIEPGTAEFVMWDDYL